MRIIKKPFYEINQWTFDLIVSKKIKTKVLVLFYLFISVIGLFYFGLLSQIENEGSGVQRPLIFYVLALVFITWMAYRSLCQFTKYGKDIDFKAKDVGLSNSDTQKVRKCAHNIMQDYVTFFAIPASMGVAYLFVNYTQLNLSSAVWLQLYAYFLVFFAALTTILAYASLFFDVIAIWMVYNRTFKKYTFFYPVSTEIFREYNKIITHGLIRFWTVGVFVLALTYIVMAHKDPIFFTIMGLAVFGFLMFTFFPFYITKKKIMELKMQTIASLVDGKDIKDYQYIQSIESILKFIQESPSQISTNYYTLYCSSLLALISTIASLKDLLPFSF